MDPKFDCQKLTHCLREYFVVDSSLLCMHTMVPIYGSVFFLSMYLSICLYTYLFSFLSIYLSIYLLIHLSICLQAFLLAHSCYCEKICLLWYVRPVPALLPPLRGTGHDLPRPPLPHCCHPLESSTTNRHCSAQSLYKYVKYLFVYLYIYASVSVCVYLSLYLSIRLLSIYLSICLQTSAVMAACPRRKPTPLDQ